jgi:hypothetical protein
LVRTALNRLQRRRAVPVEQPLTTSTPIRWRGPRLLVFEEHVGSRRWPPGDPEGGLNPALPGRVQSKTRPHGAALDGRHRGWPGRTAGRYRHEAPAALAQHGGSDDQILDAAAPTRGRSSHTRRPQPGVPGAARLAICQRLGRRPGSRMAAATDEDRAVGGGNPAAVLP